MVGSIDIKALTLDELVGVVNIYPWYGGARKELCNRMAALGDGWSQEQFSSAALYLPSRGKVSDIVRSRKTSDYPDKDIQELLRSYFEDREGEPETAVDGSAAEGGSAEGAAAGARDGNGDGGRKVYVVGGDYFTQAQYEGVRRSTDNIFSSFASKARQDLAVETGSDEFDFCTEALAQIYAEQGYPQEAKKIYSRLAVMHPEEGSRYATLIKNL